MNALPLLLYVAAAAAYAVHFARRGAASGRLATTLLMFGALGHTFVIGMQTMDVGHVPIIDPSTDERAMGVFILPLAVVLQLVPVLAPGVETRDPVLDSPWFGVHVSSLLFAYASFALAGVLGIIYVLQFKEIKKKHLGHFYTRLPSLQTLDVMNSRAVAIGWLLLTIGVAVGVIWAAQARVVAPDDPNLQAMALGDPKILLALLTWAVYSFSLLARRTLGWTGRRAAWLSAAGFAIVLLNFLPINYFVTTSHTFN